jgi:hypothetical protein
MLQLYIILILLIICTLIIKCILLCVYTSYISNHCTKVMFTLLRVSATYCSQIIIFFNISKKILIFNNLFQYVQYLQVTAPSKQETFNTARCLETAFYMLKIYVSILYMYFKVNNFSDTVQLLTVVYIKLMCVYHHLPTYNTLLMSLLYWLPEDGYKSSPKHVGA